MAPEGAPSLSYPRFVIFSFLLTSLLPVVMNVVYLSILDRDHRSIIFELAQLPLGVEYTQAGVCTPSEEAQI